MLQVHLLKAKPCRTELVDFLLGHSQQSPPCALPGGQALLCCVLAQCERCGEERKGLLGLLLGKELAFSP